MIPLALFFAATPADLAPGAQELAAAQTRYEEVYAEAEAILFDADEFEDAYDDETPDDGEEEAEAEEEEA